MDLECNKKLNGGQVMAIRQRAEAIKRYYENPQICKYCKKVIELNKEKDKVSQIRQKQFCNRSCSGFYNSDIRYNGLQKKTIKKNENRICTCGKIVVYKHRTCPYCSKTANKTKEELFKNKKNWQSARTSIRVNADLIFNYHGGLYICRVCGYAKHAELCHIKPVSDFPNDALIKEINDFNNLVPLCPTHHWEFDNDQLTDRDKNKIFSST